MKTLLLCAACVVLAASTAAAQVVTFENWPIDGAQAGTASPATGTGTVTFDTDTMLMTWNIVYDQGALLAPVTVAHFHGPADYGEDAGVQVGTGVDSPIVGQAVLTQAQADQLLAGLWYHNIHSQMHPAGEIRGQVIPEPATLGLLGLGAIALLRRRRLA